MRMSTAKRQKNHQNFDARTALTRMFAPLVIPLPLKKYKVLTVKQIFLRPTNH